MVPEVCVQLQKRQLRKIFEISLIMVHNFIFGWLLGSLVICERELASTEMYKNEY